MEKAIGFVGFWEILCMSIHADGYAIEKYFVKGEGDYVIPYLIMKPGSSNNKAIIYLNPSGNAAEASKGGVLEAVTILHTRPIK